jgi:ABC-type amino acid transport system permease subunit
VLSGTPSIVLGIFGLLVLVYYLKPITGGYSLISGSIALTILIVPVIERSIEEAVHTVPHDLEEGSYALGATKWETTRFITIPSALAGIVTGIILGLGRAAEESAVVILTAGYTQFMPEFTFRPNDKLLFNTKIYPFQDLIGSLPYSVYHAYENSNVIPLSNGFAAAFILIMIILFINIIAKMVFWYGSRSLKKSHPVISSLKKTIFNSEKKNKKLGEKRFSFSKEPIKNLNSSTKDGPSDYFQLTRPIHPTWTSALTQPVQPASPVPSIESGENPHVLSSVHHDPGMPWDDNILPDDTRELPFEMDLPSGTITDNLGAEFEAVPFPELFEDKPPANLESGRVRVPGFGGEYEPDALLAEPGDDLLLMEEPPVTAQPKPTANPYENWPLMAKNQWENTDV